MTQYEEVRFQQFDQVRLRTTKNVKYLSAPPDTVVSPKGIWSVAAVVKVEDAYDLLLVKNSVTIRIPAVDVLKTVAYDIAEITHQLGRFTDGKGKGRKTSSAKID
jgi:hypothetical protein